jgi:phosphatidylserine decarboxylase
MDPFVVASLGRKTYRTRVIRHNLNPVFEEKMVFQVMRHEQNYSLSFSVVDRDKLSGNDFVGTASLPLSTVIASAPEADPETGLYRLQEPPDAASLPTPKGSRFKLPVSRSASSQSLNKMSRPSLTSRNSQSSMTTSFQPDTPPIVGSAPTDPNLLTPVSAQFGFTAQSPDESTSSHEDPDLKIYTLPLILKNKERWEDKHNPQLIISAKYLPYPALRQQFWRAMLRQYDSDENARVSKLELTTMLDTLGSTLKESTIDGYFQRFAKDSSSQDPGSMHLTFDQTVICLEDQLQQPPPKKSWGETVKGYMDHAHLLGDTNQGSVTKSNRDAVTGADMDPPAVSQAGTLVVPTISQEELGLPGETGDLLEPEDLADDRGEEHVVEVRECPICHQPRLNKKSDADIITHIATCASQDWRQVNNLVMAGFVTSSQAQRKWYSKVITKISYGGYKLGANSANILVQDRLTGQINEERMSVYVRLGIRLLYKGLKSKDMEKKRSKLVNVLLCLLLTRISSEIVEVVKHQAGQKVRRSRFCTRDSELHQFSPPGYKRGFAPSRKI